MLTGLLVLPGCGSSGKSVSASELAAACQPALEAKGGYNLAMSTMSIRFTNAPLRNATLTATRAFKARAAHLRTLLSGSDAAEVGRLGEQLTLVEKLLEAFAANDKAGVKKYGEGLNPGLNGTIAGLEKICRPKKS